MLDRYLKFILAVIIFYTTVILGVAIFNLYKVKTEKWEFPIVNFTAFKKSAIVCENFLDGSPKSTINLPIRAAGDEVIEGEAHDRLQCDYDIPLSVIIDNEISAPAPAGLGEAKVVFEALVEGGVTRYLAFFDSKNELEKIGPVRSARPYFLDWTEGHRALLVHAGGSPESLRQLFLTRNGLINLDEISSDGGYFFRDKKNLAPHNLYTSSVLIKTALEIKYNLFKKTSLWTEAALADFYQENKWLYQDDNNSAKNQVSQFHPHLKPIVINFSTFGYKVRYEYKSEEDNYLRFLADKIQLTESGESIRVKNIIVIWLKTYLADELRLGMQTIGQGQAIICHSGVCADGLWRKDKPENRIQFLNPDGQKIALARGNTWIEVLPLGREVEY